VAQKWPAAPSFPPLGLVLLVRHCFVMKNKHLPCGKINIKHNQRLD